MLLQMLLLAGGGFGGRAAAFAPPPWLGAGKDPAPINDGRKGLTDLVQPVCAECSDPVVQKQQKIASTWWKGKCMNFPPDRSCPGPMCVDMCPDGGKDPDQTDICSKVDSEYVVSITTAAECCAACKKWNNLEPLKEGLPVRDSRLGACISWYLPSPKRGCILKNGCKTPEECKPLPGISAVCMAGPGCYTEPTPWGRDVIVMVLITAAAYLGLGTAYSVRVKEARLDVRALPNYAFWRSVPGLVSDGVAMSRRVVAGKGYRSVGESRKSVRASIVKEEEARAVAAYEVGEAVQYYSESKKSWVSAKVKKIGKTSIDLDIKRSVKPSAIRAVNVVAAKGDKKAAKKLKEQGKELEAAQKEIAKADEKAKKAKKEAKAQGKAATAAMAEAKQALVEAKQLAAAAKENAAKSGDGGGGSRSMGPARASGGGDQVWAKIDRAAAKDLGAI